MSDLEDGINQEYDNRHSNSIKYPRPLNLNTTRAIHLVSTAMEDHPVLELLQPTQDGGNFSDTKTDSLSTIKERLWMSMATEMKRTETSSFGTNTEEPTNNGTASTLKDGQRNQRRDNTTKTSVCMFRETSTSKHN
jgi:hypothetical protein